MITTFNASPFLDVLKASRTFSRVNLWVTKDFTLTHLDTSIEIAMGHALQYQNIPFTSTSQVAACIRVTLVTSEPSPTSTVRTSGIDACLDGRLHTSALNSDFWLEFQETFYFIGDSLGALLGDLEDKVSPNFLSFIQPRGRQIGHHHLSLTHCLATSKLTNPIVPAPHTKTLFPRVIPAHREVWIPTDCGSMANIVRKFCTRIWHCAYRISRGFCHLGA